MATVCVVIRRTLCTHHSNSLCTVGVQCSPAEARCIQHGSREKSVRGRTQIVPGGQLLVVRVGVKDFLGTGVWQRIILGFGNGWHFPFSSLCVQCFDGWVRSWRLVPSPLLCMSLVPNVTSCPRPQPVVDLVCFCGFYFHPESLYGNTFLLLTAHSVLGFPTLLTCIHPSAVLSPTLWVPLRAVPAQLGKVKQSGTGDPGCGMTSAVKVSEVAVPGSVALLI